MAVSLLCSTPSTATILLRLTGGRYEQFDVTVAGAVRHWWRRVPISITARFAADDLAGGPRRVVTPKSTDSHGLGKLQLSLAVFTRPRDSGRRLLTLSVTNKTPTSRDSGAVDGACLFQTHFSVEISAEGRGLIESYPDRSASGGGNDEDESFALLYRRHRTYAIGHGCAADWDAPPGSDAATTVTAEALPWFETPSVTPDITDPLTQDPLRVSMAKLAGLDATSDGFSDAADLLDRYDKWIEQREQETVPSRNAEAAARHLRDCRTMLKRMRAGLAFIRSDGRARRAFQLANHAVLLQQLRSKSTSRSLAVDASGAITFREAFVERSWRDETERGYWRPFQLGFLLATAQSIALADDPDRSRVDLIFFPTGGGKTEAYLGQSAFAIFYRRILDPGDIGVHVLMRYTLRLLTTQQFLRAAGLICAMEHLRQEQGDLGGAFGIGAWLGGSNTPNTRQEAREQLAGLQKGRAENPFMLLRCPWCAAQMGPLRAKGHSSRKPAKGDEVLTPGYRRSGDTVALYCPDQECEFAAGLPVLVIDEDIFEKRPSIVIGTVDKFARLAWSPEPRGLFGLGPDGSRQFSPPGLIIQDELHLIAGPLGSMVGLYETLIEELCIDRRLSAPKLPKIVASTATIRRYAAQINALYARDRVSLFPPQGLEAGDSFFARYAVDSNGKALPGRRFVGIHAPGLGSVQTAQVRTFAALLQAPAELKPGERDPWITLVGFFNSLRELGTSLTLLQSDIPDYLLTLRNRYDISSDARRYVNRVMELTSRLRDDEVPAAIEELQQPESSGRAIDVCLASSILEVGIDIERLSLMALLGQPKSTSQYIQVTGRIGRRWWDRPGLVAVIYSASKPRDRSHYERFRSYHERLYANVEPTSVTPFASPVLARALHAVLVAYVRQFGDEKARPWPMPKLAEAAAELLRARVNAVDASEVAALEKALERRLGEWASLPRTVWQKWSWSGDEDEPIPVIRPAGEWAPEVPFKLSWPTPNSMRNVDAECRAFVTPAYAMEELADA